MVWHVRQGGGGTSKRYWGIWVVLPQPGSPTTTVTRHVSTRCRQGQAGRGKSRGGGGPHWNHKGDLKPLREVHASLARQ